MFWKIVPCPLTFDELPQNAKLDAVISAPAQLRKIANPYPDVWHSLKQQYET
jgi:hypothetical protein